MFASPYKLGCSRHCSVRGAVALHHDVANVYIALDTFKNNQPGTVIIDTDNNGYLDERDFACLALRATIIEGKGEFSFSRLQEYQHIMLSLWEEIAELADFNRDGKITVEEFKQAVQQCCVGRRYEDFPQAMKMFIDSNFKMVDLNDDGVIEADEYRFNCVTKFAIDDIEVVDEAFNNLLNDDDRRRGGITLSRYQELYAQFLGNPDETCPAVYLFGPLSEFFHYDDN